MRYTCEALGVMFAVVISGYAGTKMSQWNLAEWIKCRVNRTLAWVKQNVAPGFRFVLGLLLVCGGIFGFLPVLGFWMMPLGIAVAALDIRPLSRFFCAASSPEAKMNGELASSHLEPEWRNGLSNGTTNDADGSLGARAQIPWLRR